MEWSHPALLFGLAAAGLPILIHLIGKKNAPIVPFAAFDFLLAVTKRLARRERLKQFLLLLLRTLIVIGLVAALARPFFPSPQAAAGTRNEYVFIIDVSPSMGFVSDGQTLLAHAISEVSDALSRLSAEDRAAVVISGQTPRSLSESPVANPARLITQLKGITLEDNASSMAAAIDVASTLFTDSEDTTRVLTLVSDLARNAWIGVRPLSLDPAPEIRLVRPGVGTSAKGLPNLAIEDMELRSDSENPNQRTVSVRVHNYGPSPVNKGGIMILVNGEEQQRTYVDVPANASAEKTVTLSFDEPGVKRIEARLQGGDEGFQQDDNAFAIEELVAAMKVLVLNGEPKTTPYEDEVFFIERALQATPRGSPPIDAKILTVDEFVSPQNTVVLDDYAVALFCQVNALGPERLSELESWLQGGGGLVVSVGPVTNFEKLNDSYGPLLPTALRDLHQAHDEAAGTPALAIAELAEDHPILHGLGEEIVESLQASRTRAYFNVATGRSDSHVLMRLDNGAPLLLERGNKQGTVLLWTTSLDIDLTDIPLRSAFPPLLQYIVRYAGNGLAFPRAAGLRAHATAELALPPGAQSVVLTHEAGKTITITQEDTMVTPKLPGFYAATVQQGSKPLRDERFDVAVSPSLAESDYTPISEGELRRLLTGEGESEDGLQLSLTALSTSFETQRQISSLLLLLVVFFFVGESLLASR